VQASPEWASGEHQAANLAVAMDEGTQLIDAGYIVDLAEAGGIVPRCQDVETHAVVSREQMELWRAGHSLAVLVLSYVRLPQACYHGTMFSSMPCHAQLCIGMCIGMCACM
jgi:hypothetical protein